MIFNRRLKSPDWSHNSCKIFQICHKNCRLPDFIAKAAIFKFWVFLVISMHSQSATKLSTCRRVALSLGLFSCVTFTFLKMTLAKWLFFFSYTNRLKPSAKAKLIDIDRKSEFSKQNGQNPPDPSWCQEKLQMQTVWLFFQQTFQVENPHVVRSRKKPFVCA